ncbi:MAG: tetratricopeptide repeat protein [Anaerolineae bacterium]|nr:tetratricopeptide repeat protein [Anaerolineae bacterium]
MAGTLHIHLLDHFRLLHDDVPLTGVDTPRLQSFLAYLLLHRAAPQARSHLSFLFWPDSTESQARTNLRKQLYHLRQALPDPDYFVHADSNTIHWHATDHFTLDVARLEQALNESEQAQKSGDAEAQRAALECAASLHAGDLLPNCYDDWVLAERERLRRRALYGLEQLAAILEEQHAYKEAARHVEHLLRLDPLHEQGYRQLMRLLALQGNRAAAIRTYHTCATRLHEELEVAPDAATQQLYRSLLELDVAHARPVTSSEPGGEVVAGWPLVGRDAAWLQLQATWQELRSGRQHLVLLTGEAGIGKTRLAEECVAWARRQGVATAVARCYESGQGLAYGPVADWLRSEPMQQVLRTLDPVWLTEVARIVPEVLVRRPETPHPQPMTEPWQRQHLFEAMALPFANQRHLMLLIDDIHWADRETIDWLSYLMHRRPRTGDAPALMVVATARIEELPHRQPLQTLFDELDHSGQMSEIELDPLDAEESIALATGVAGRPIDPVLAGTLYRETEGNPLFLVETVRAALSGADSGISAAAAQLEQASLPPAVHNAVLSRLAHLSPQARDLVNIAAVIGRQFSFDVLAQAASGGETFTSEDGLARALDELWQRRIVRQSSATDYDFAHDKIRQVAYDDLGPARRRHLHRRVARALAQVHAHSLDAQSWQIARHYEQGGAQRESIDYYRRAAAVARRIYANDDATGIYRHLLDSDLAAALGGAEVCAIMLDLGAVWQLTGDWPAAERIYRQALARAEAEGSTEMCARGHFSLGNLVRQQGAYDDALHWLAMARDGFESAGDDRGLVRALWAIGEVYWYKGDHAGALEALERQAEIASNAGDQRGMCDAAGTMAIVYWSLGEFARARELCLQSIEIAESINHWWGVGRALLTIGNTYSSEGDISAAFATYEQAFKVASEIGDRQCKSWAVANIGELYSAAGQHRAALAHYQHTLQVAIEIGETWSVGIALMNMAEASVELGNPSLAEGLFHKAIALARALDANYLGAYLLSLALFYDRQNRHHRARRYNDEALRLAGEPESERMAGENIHFRSRLLDVRLRYRLGEIHATAAHDELVRLLADYQDDTQRALIHYEMWQIDPADTTRREEAARLYRALAPGLLRGEVRRDYAGVTGEAPPSVPPLPGPVQVPVEANGGTGTWLAQVDALIARLQATP